MSKHVLPAVKHPFPLLRVQLVDEICGEVLVGVLIPVTSHTHARTRTHNVKVPVVLLLQYRGTLPSQFSYTER